MTKGLRHCAPAWGVCLLGLISCQQPTTPVTAGAGAESVVTSISDDGAFQSSLIRVDAFTATIVARRELGGYLEGATLSADSNLIYAGIASINGRRELLAINARSLREEWRLRLSERLQPAFGPIGIRTAEVLTPSVDGTSLYVWRAEQDNVVGIAAVDLASRRTRAFSGPWNVAGGGMVAIPRGAPTLPNGALAVIASRENAATGPRRQSMLFLLDLQSLAPLDSVTPQDLGGSSAATFWDVAVVANGRELVIGNEAELVRFDLATRRVLGRTSRIGSGPFSVEPASGTVVLADNGRFPDSPGRGLLQLFRADLTANGTIDISTPLGGVPNGPTALVMGFVGRSADGKSVFVRTGTSPIGTLYPAQPARLLLVDLTSRTVRASVALGGAGLGYVFVVK